MSKFNWGMRACTVFLLWAATAVALPAQAPSPTFTTIYSFCSAFNSGICIDGASPQAGLVQGTNGILYGTTYSGGSGSSSCPNGCGTIFAIYEGQVISLYYLCSQSNCSDGAGPQGSLVQGANGDLYGTTVQGGANNDGTVFSLDSNENLMTLHSFDSTDGSEPEAALVQGTSGKFYGTTYQGGANTNSFCPSGCGTAFSITASGTLKVLHSFAGRPTDGALPTAGLVQGTNGKFYGTTSNGGAIGAGTVFSMTSGGTVGTLHSFEGTDGEVPYAGLVQGTDGKFYGTAENGGAGNHGTVFSITAGGTLKTLHSFCRHSGCKDGAYPEGPLVQGSDGNFYGTTSAGGANTNSSCPSGCGTIFVISPTPPYTLTTIYNFCSQGGSSCTDGKDPFTALAQDTNGTFYGTVYGGGAKGQGAVFSLSVGLGPFVVTEPTSGAVGAAVTILGNNLTSPCTVTFYNNVSAGCIWVSSSEITTTVPTGATTGTVQVATSGSGNLSSNVPFRVRP